MTDDASSPCDARRRAPAKDFAARRFAIAATIAVLTLGAHDARGEDETKAEEPSVSCAARRLVETPRALTNLWHSAVVDLREELASRTECSHLPRLTVVPFGAGVRVTATDSDGRTAERFAARPGDLRILAIGLLASAPPEPPPPESPPSRNEVPSFDAPPVAKRVDRPWARLDVALSAGALLGQPTRMVALDTELRADVWVDDWALSARLQYAPISAFMGPPIPGFGYDEVTLGLGAARRWRPAAAATFDVDVGASIALMAEVGDVTPTGAIDDQDELRLFSSVRVSFGTSQWKPLVAFEAAVAPLVLTSPPRVDPALPPLPTWTLALRAGLVGDIL